MRGASEARRAMEADIRALARGSMVCSYLREKGLLIRNPHLVLRFADTLLASLRGLRFGPGQ